jgi:hypothetical protein
MTEIRPARAADALRVAGQLAQLGYPSELDRDDAAATTAETTLTRAGVTAPRVVGVGGHSAGYISSPR